MLIRVEIENFKNFKNRLIFDLTKNKNYKFNSNCIKNSIANNILIYGHNGSGKSNLGYAIFDIISHLTDKNSNKEHVYQYYANAENKDDKALFKYHFKFDNNIVIYSYSKKNIDTLLKEELYINDVLYASIDREKNNIATINAKGAETLKEDISSSKVSILSYIEKNANLIKDDKNNITFQNFLDFVNKMLFFRSLEGNSYLGFEQGSTIIDQDIISNNNVEDFEKFLNEMGIKCKLASVNLELLNKKVLVFDFKNNKIPFFDIASSGTKSLALFYYWLQRLKKEEVKFLFIDEFDAFYHHDLAYRIIEQLKKLNIQTIVTTHNTSLMSNDLLRPDCYFFIGNNKIDSLANLTKKEIREAHNIEKMYKAHAFAN